MVSILKIAAVFFLGAGMVSAQILQPANGGTGLDTSGSTGCPSITAGTWSIAGCSSLPSTVVQTNQANTYGAFLQDLSAATVKLPSSFMVGSNTITNPSSTGTLALTSQLPATFAAVAHQWLNSYAASTGLFTATQPAFSDISGTASTAQIGTGTPAAGTYVDGASGVWTALPAAGITGSGTSGYVPRWTGASVLANGSLQDDGAEIGIGTAPSATNIVAVLGATGATASAGQAVQVTSGPGGADGGSGSGAGGNLTLSAGAGGAETSAVVGLTGNGGSFTLSGGASGALTYGAAGGSSTAGTGGSFTMISGAGGVATSSGGGGSSITGGANGFISISQGNPGSATASHISSTVTGGTSQAFNIISGAGGLAKIVSDTGSTANGGGASSFSMESGNGGAVQSGNIPTYAGNGIVIAGTGGGFTLRGGAGGQVHGGSTVTAGSGGSLAFIGGAGSSIANLHSGATGTGAPGGSITFQPGNGSNSALGVAAGAYGNIVFNNYSSNATLTVDGKTGSINSSISQTTYLGSTSGTAVWSMPFQGASYKKFLINLQVLNDAGGTITFPTAFTKTPYVYGDAAAIAVSSASTTTLTLALTAGVTGNVFVEGY